MAEKDTPQVMIAIDQITKRYQGSKEMALRGISLTINKGEFFGLLGPNGSGKTTLISILCGLLSSTGGQITINGFTIPRQFSAIKSFVNLVPQDVALYPTLTLRENLQFFGRLYHLSSQAMKDRIDYCIQVARLENFADREIGTYSGGMKRRANLVASLMNKPELLFLDEPSVNLDPQSRNVIFEILKETNRSGTTLIYTTHYLEEAEQLCQRVAIIDRGRVIKVDTPPNLIRNTPGSLNLADVFLHLTGHQLRDES